MTKFSFSQVEALEYDFTGAPANTGGKCKGKGIIPEPTKARRDEFIAFREKYAEAIKDATDGELDGDAFKEKWPDLKEGLMSQVISDLCSGKPSVAELEELPPRIFSHFTKWLVTELFDPKG